MTDDETGHRPTDSADTAPGDASGTIDHSTGEASGTIDHSTGEASGTTAVPPIDPLLGDRGDVGGSARDTAGGSGRPADDEAWPADPGEDARSARGRRRRGDSPPADDRADGAGWDPDRDRLPENPPDAASGPWEIPPYDPMGDSRLAYEDQILRENEDWVRLPRPWGLLRRIALVVTVLVALLGGSAWFVNDWLQRQLDPPGEPGEVVTIEVPEGASTNDIATILEDEGVVPNATVARYYFRYKGAGPFLAGEYAIATNSAIWEVREVLEAGPLPESFETITIPEGLWLSQIVPRLLDQLPGFDAAELDTALESGNVRSRFQPQSVDTLEGLLFPDTYAIDEDSAANEIALVQRMVAQFDSVLTNVGYDSAEAVTGYTPYELVIIASLIEEEAFVPEDRAKISRVIHNRLEQGMPLQIDATVLYAIGEQTTEITESDLETDSPYNTYVNEGLPPTPIAAPGRAALEAALNPAEGPWLFYVLADEDGSHYFTDDIDDFNRQVAESRAQGLF